MTPAAMQGHGRRLLLLAVLGLAAVHLALQLWQLGRGTRYVVSHLTIDDTFYYLQTAWLTTKLHFVTFDGLHATNGVQLLWFGICLPLAAVSPTRISLLYATLAVGTLINVTCHALIWRIGGLLSRPALALWMSACWLAVSLGTVYSRGLQNSLHALVFWWVIAQALAFLLALERGDRTPGLLPLTL